MTEKVGSMFGWTMGLCAFAGWCQSIVTSVSEGLWGLLVAAAFFFPAAVVHGWGVWFDWWR